jgi:glycosyltransferase involved in cell wall biosynthesis
MNILLIAPNPFYQERGTPIAIKLMLETLCKAGHRIDVLTYHEGQDLVIPGLKIYRILKIPIIKNIPVGFSLKKVVCDVFLSLMIFKKLYKSNYHVIHAVEESIFPAIVANAFSKKKLIYDMDSSIVDQLLEKWQFLNNFNSFLYKFEKFAVRYSHAVFAVCDDLVKRAHFYYPEKQVFLIEDAPLMSENDTSHTVENLRLLYGIKGHLALYVGNLEHYQGIDLMIKSIALIKSNLDLNLIIIGGIEKDIHEYKSLAKNLKILDRVHFMGQKPVACLNGYLKQADVLVSPRKTGNNTPLKIYSYLAAGKAILATDIRSHTQVLNPTCALLVAPEEKAIAQGLNQLLENFQLMKSLAEAGQSLAEKTYSLHEFRRKVLSAYSKLEEDL